MIHVPLEGQCIIVTPLLNSSVVGGPKNEDAYFGPSIGKCRPVVKLGWANLHTKEFMTHPFF